jgi:hypothetical protein
MQLPEGFTVKALLFMIVICLVAIVCILHQNTPGRYQYSGDTVIDTKTGVVKYVNHYSGFGIPFEKLPDPEQSYNYDDELQEIKDRMNPKKHAATEKKESLQPIKDESKRPELPLNPKARKYYEQQKKEFDQLYNEGIKEQKQP